MTRRMKDSGVEWIGLIPEDWKIEKTKYHFFNKKEIVGIKADNYERLALTLKGVVKRSKDDNEGLQPEKFETYQILRKNELVFKLIDLQNISTSRIGLSNFIGIVSPAYIIIKANNNINVRFVEKYYLSLWYFQIFNKLGDAGVRSSLNANDLLNILLPIPPLPEQQAIADYLDDKCAQIDNITATINEQIEVLKQYKKSVITEAVTKGLDPNVPMKDSGVDIFGKIPFSWNLIRLKYLTEITTGNMDTQDAEEDGIYPFYVRSPKVEHSNVYTFDGEGILMAGDGAGAGKVFHHAYGKFAVHQRVYIIYNFKNINSNFLFYFLENLFSEEINKGSAQSTVPSIRLYMLHNFNVCVPTIREQEAIADYLDDKCTKIDAIIVDKQAQLETLAAYKKSLIYEYVTGKKSVPGFEEA